MIGPLEAQRTNNVDAFVGRIVSTVNNIGARGGDGVKSNRIESKLQFLRKTIVIETDDQTRPA